jgi:hypothetical protein
VGAVAGLLWALLLGLVAGTLMAALLSGCGAARETAGAAAKADDRVPPASVPRDRDGRSPRCSAPSTGARDPAGKPLGKAGPGLPHSLTPVVPARIIEGKR